jgi:hypothetical protein
MMPIRVLKKAAAVAILAAAVLPFVAYETRAADAAGNFAVKGVGLAPCTDVAKAIEQQSELFLQMGGWIAGYLTALNQTRGETYDLLSWQDDATVAAAILGWCRTNPSARLVEAAAAMANSLTQARVKAASPVLVIEGTQPPLRLYAETLRRAQESLARFGFDPGERGTFGAGSRTAFARYQAKAGLAQTGVPDRDTLYALLIAESSARGAAQNPAAPKPATAR